MTTELQVFGLIRVTVNAPLVQIILTRRVLVLVSMWMLPYSYGAVFMTPS